MIELKNVTKKYGEIVILNETSYTFPEKGIVCLLGASGSGKTTLLNLLAGFDTDYEGEIAVGGTAINRLQADALCQYRKDNIGFVFQNYHLLPGYTVLENVTLACELSGIYPDESIRQADLLLKKLNISEKRNQTAETLSGGQKQRAAIARALINNPQILLADEPTGALDRVTTNEIMELLSEISKSRLVVLITHDADLCKFADEIMYIEDHKIISECMAERTLESKKLLIKNTEGKRSAWRRGLKNLKVHLGSSFFISLSVSVGLLVFLLSLSFGNVAEQSIKSFQEKNTAFSNGYIKGPDDGTILSFLERDGRMEHIYYQYKLQDLVLSMKGKSERMTEKYPMPKATESLSYGIMPRRDRKEIALTPSLAGKFDAAVKDLLGLELELTVNGRNYPLTVSGIYNAGYDDFMISSDIEQLIYAEQPGRTNYSISYDVKEFDEIAAVSNMLKMDGLESVNSSDEVSAFQNTFRSIRTLFFVISILVLGMGIFICMMLLIKRQNTRYRELGLLSALGFCRTHIRSVVLSENILLSVFAALVDLILLGLTLLLSHLLELPFKITAYQMFFSAAAAMILLMVFSSASSYQLLHTEPAEALRK